MATILPVAAIEETVPRKVRKVLLLCDFFNSIGGTERYNALLAEGLQARGIEVRIYIGEKPRLPYWRSLLDKAGIFYREPEEFHKSLTDNDIERRFIADHVDEINAWKPDVIQVHPFKKMAIAWLKNPKSDKTIPMVATEWTVPTLQAKHWFEEETGEYINQVRTYIATCDAIERGLRNYHEYTGPIVKIPHILESSSFVKPADQKDTALSVGFIGRLSVEKGVDFLLGAWRQVHEVYPEATLHLYGHGADQERLEQLRDCLGLQDVVTFEGVFDPRGGLAEVAARHSIFVQPSLFESIPTSLIELMLCGRTMVACDVGGISELIREDTGRLVGPGSTDQIAQALLELLGSPELTARLGANAAALTQEKYNYDRTLDAIIATYESVMNTVEEPISPEKASLSPVLV